MRIDVGEEEAPEIGLIALIDCIFFLLMFFMVATSFKHQDGTQAPKQTPIRLPAAEGSVPSPGALRDPLVIGVDAAGRLFVDERAVTTTALRDLLHAEAARDPGRAVRIDGDTRAAYQDILHVLDLCQFEGLTHVSMHTRSGR
jgi:biopolymer transport protein ExbD